MNFPHKLPGQGPGQPARGAGLGRDLEQMDPEVPPNSTILAS